MKSDKKKLAKLSMAIIEHKFLYYEGAKYGLEPLVSDQEYDRIENLYKKYAKKLGEPTTASSMVGFDESRPVCKLVKDRLISNKGKSDIKIKIKKRSKK